MSPEEFEQWWAYDQFVAPLGDQRIVRQLALIACILANVNRSKGRAPFEVDDFDLFRDVDTVSREQEEEHFRATWAAAGLVVKAAPED